MQLREFEHSQQKRDDINFRLVQLNHKIQWIIVLTKILEIESMMQVNVIKYFIIVGLISFQMMNGAETWVISHEINEAKFLSWEVCKIEIELWFNLIANQTQFQKLKFPKIELCWFRLTLPPFRSTKRFLIAHSLTMMN